jgi:hypothetical protein
MTVFFEVGWTLHATGVTTSEVFEKNQVSDGLKGWEETRRRKVAFAGRISGGRQSSARDSEANSSQ